MAISTSRGIEKVGTVSQLIGRVGTLRELCFFRNGIDDNIHGEIRNRCRNLMCNGR
jgi:hypothetical protein